MSAPRSAHHVLALTAACLLVALGLSLLVGWGAPPWWALLLLAAAVSVSEVAVVHLQFGRQRWTLSLIEAAIAGALVVEAGAWVVVAVAAGVVMAMVIRRQSPLKLARRTGLFAAATAVSVVVAEAAGGGVVGALFGMSAFWVVHYCLVVAVVVLTTARGTWTVVASSAPLSLLHTVANTSLGLLAAFLAQEAPVGLLGLVVPVALLWTSYDQEARRSAEARLFAELARGQEQASSRSTDVSAQVVLTAAARLFGGADVEMLLLAPDGPVRYAGDGSGIPRRLRVDQDAFDQPWVIRALGARGVSTGSEEGRPYCAAVLGDASAPLAVLVARRARGAASYGRREVRLVQVLAGQAEAWLSVSDLSERYEVAAGQAAAAGGAARALGELGAATTPALTVLRDSAERLTRLADGGGLDDVVQELHLVERAVASLLGAIALAAEPELLTGAPEGQQAPDLALPRRAATDWTTTGVLR